MSAQFSRPPHWLELVQTTEGWLSNDVALLFSRLIASAPKQSHLLEVGSWKGKSTICLAANAGPEQKVHAVDPFTGSQEHHHLFGQKIDTYGEFVKNLKRTNLYHKIIVHKATSNIASQDFNQPLGFIFIDGSHEYPDVLADFQCWFPLLLTGGYIAFHDSKWPGVKKVLWEEVFTNRYVGLIRRVEDTTYARKLDKPKTLIYLCNRLHLYLLKGRQSLKRAKRRLRKCRTKIF